MRLRHTFHPLGLLLGNFITFHVPPDSRRAAFGFASDRLVRRGSKLVIGNDYATWTHDIFAQMNHFRGVATGAESPLGGPLRVGDARAPQSRWTFRKDRRPFKLWHVAGLALSPVAGMAVGSLVIDGLPEFDISSLLDSLSGYLFAALVGTPWLIVTGLKRNAAQDNMVTLSAGGLGTRHGTETRHWLWWEMSEIKITQSTSRGKGGSVASIVSFRAMQDGALPGKVLLEGKAAVPVSCTIEDAYEMPVEEIGRQIKAWWEWNNKAFGHPDDPDIARLIEDEIGQQPRAISFLKQRGQQRQGSVLEAPLPWLAMLPLAAWTGLLLWDLKTGMPLQISWWGSLAGLALFGAVPLIGVLVSMATGKNRIQLDDDGFRFVRLGRTSRWRWSEIGPGEVRRVRGKWSAKQRPVLTFETPVNGIGSAFLRWAFNIDNRHVVVIEDIYDASLEEIAEAINARRRTFGRAPRR